MAYNICTTPMRQTLFLGCSIASFSISVGWNDQVGELTVQLAEDTCAVPPGGNAKVYWDYELNPQSTMDADPGFITPNLGSPVYFRVGDFEWSGIVQSYDESRGTDGNPIYTVKLVDPRQILEHAQIITAGYAGSVNGMANLINVYGYTETFGVNATLQTVYGATFGSPAGKFGGAMSNENGMPWVNIQGNLQRLVSAATPFANTFSPYGRLTFRDGYGVAATGGGPNSNIGCGIIPGDGGSSFYILDLSEMPLASPYWKISSQNISILAAISEICQNASCDFYIELLPTLYNSTLYKVIKVRTASRISQPSLTAIDDFITLHGATGIIRSTVGRELRNEPVSTFIAGGYKQGVYQVYNDSVPITNSDADEITPYFGLDPLTGNVVVPNTITLAGVDDPVWRFTVSNVMLNQQLDSPLQGTTLTINELELLSAIAGFDVWQSHVQTAQTDTYVQFTGSKKGLYQTGADHLSIVLGQTKHLSVDQVNLSIGPYSSQQQDPLQKQEQTIYNFVAGYANEYYGKQFMVKLPYIAATLDQESQRVVVTDSPSDGAWSEDSNGILGLTHPSAYTDFFSLDDGRVACFTAVVVDTSGVNFDKINKEETLIFNNLDGVATLYMKSEVLPDVVYTDVEDRTSPRAVVVLPDAIYSRVPIDSSAVLDYMTNAAPQVSATGSGKAIQNSALRSMGGAALQMPFPERSTMIRAAAIPMRSNVNTYGPWGASAASGSVWGGVRVQQDNGLTPWDYGGMSAMNLAGAARVFEEQYSSMQVAEMGSIEVDGYPTIPLGAELGAYDNGVFGAGYHLVENRTATTGVAPVSTGGYVYVPMGGWSGIYGPNITSIDVQVGVNGITTKYGMRTYTPSFGRYSRFNAERIKEDGLRALQAQKQLRAARLQQARMAAVQTKQKSVYSGRPVAQGKVNVSHSPHSVIGGQSIQWGASGSRSHVATMELSDAGREFRFDYDQKAFMSLDGLLRPVSLFGDGGLPRFAIPVTGRQKFASAGAIPPLQMPTGLPELSSGGKVSGYSLTINNLYLNSLMSHFTHSGDGSGMYGVSSGHDITILGHGNEPPSGNSSMNLYVRGSGMPTYAEDYRFLALKGPLIMHGWGFDLDGKPVPNKADTDARASGGIFISSGLKDLFLDDWLQKSHTWPVGPIDLRWDRQRAVWTVPQYRMVVGQVVDRYNSGVYSGEYKCQLVFGENLSSPSGERLTPTSGYAGGTETSDYPHPTKVPSFPLKDTFNMGYGSGSMIMGYYEPQKNEFIGIIPSRTFMATLTSTLVSNSSATAEVWRYSGNGGGVLVNTKETIRVYDWLLKSTQTLSSGTRIIAYYDAASKLAILQEARCA